MHNTSPNEVYRRIINNTDEPQKLQAELTYWGRFLRSARDAERTAKRTKPKSEAQRASLASLLYHSLQRRQKAQRHINLIKARIKTLDENGRKSSSGRR